MRLHDPATNRTHVAETVGEVLSAAGSPRLIGLALSRRIALVRTVRLPNVSKSDAIPVLRLQLDRFFPISSAELAYDFAFLDDVNGDGRLALVCAVKADLLRQAHADIKAAGAKIAWCAPTAMGAVQMAQEFHDTDAVVVEATPDGLGIDALRDGGLIYSRSVVGAESLEIEIARTKAAADVPNAHVIGTPNIDATQVQDMAPRSVLAELAEFGPNEFDIRLPEEVAKKLAAVDNSRRNRALLICITAFAAACYVWDDYDQARTRVKKHVEAEQRKQKPLKDQIGQVASRSSEAGAKADALKLAFDPAQRTSEVLAVAANLAPSGAWLNGVTFDRGRPLQIRGTAKTHESVSQYVDNLSRESRFRDVRLIFANNGKIEDTPVVQFSITAHVIGNLPLVEREGK